MILIYQTIDQALKLQEPPCNSGILPRLRPTEVKMLLADISVNSQHKFHRQSWWGSFGAVTPPVPSVGEAACHSGMLGGGHSVGRGSQWGVSSSSGTPCGGQRTPGGWKTGGSAAACSSSTCCSD